MRYETSYIKNDDGGNILTTFIEKEVKKFICQAPISSGKWTALRKWIYNCMPNNKFILILPTIYISLEF